MQNCKNISIIVVILSGRQNLALSKNGDLRKIKIII